jgi:hypothetical protein
VGRTARALEYLERAVDAGYRHFDWIACEPDFEPVRGEPRILALPARWYGPEPAGRDGQVLRALAGSAAPAPSAGAARS